jgi:hypothetical protein
MAYEVVLSERARDSLNALEETLRSFVDAHLLKLGQSPSAISQPTVSPPYPPGFMVSEFDYDLDEATPHHFAVFFRYAADEVRIIVSAIGHTALDRP